MKQPTKEQLKRYEELQDKAVNWYLDKTDFSVEDWLSKEDEIEYHELERIIEPDLYI